MSESLPTENTPKEDEVETNKTTAISEKIDNTVSSVISSLSKNESPSPAEKDKKKSLWTAGADDGYSSYTSTPKSLGMYHKTMFLLSIKICQLDK